MIESVGTKSQRKILANSVGTTPTQPKQPTPVKPTQPTPTQPRNNLLIPPAQTQAPPPIVRPAAQPKQAAPDARFRRIVTGDSIATGIGYGGARGDDRSEAQWGRNAQTQLNYLQQKGSAYYKGNDVTLSSGLLNDASQIDAVKKQIEFLLAAGVNSIRLAGGPTSGNYSGVNVTLEKLAKQYGIHFIGGYTPSSDQVHPTTYNGYQ